MKSQARVAVASRSFSKHHILRAELLSRFENVTFNDAGKSLSEQELIAFLRGHERAITALETINAEILSELPELKLISKYGVGTDMIDKDALKKFGVHLSWTPGVNRRSVSELALCFMILMLHKAASANQEVRSGVWKQSVGLQLTGKTVGILGCGNVGQDLIRLLAPFDCPTQIHDIEMRNDVCEKFGVAQVSLEELLAESDIVSVHVPLDNTTRGLLSEEKLFSMKKGAVLINLARGGIVDEVALKACLKSGHISGAAFVVFESEPPQDHELLKLPNFFATPHIGGSAEEAILAMGRSAIQGLEIVG